MTPPMAPGEDTDSGAHKRVPAPEPEAPEEAMKKLGEMKKELDKLAKERSESSGRGAVAGSKEAGKLKDAARAPAKPKGEYTGEGMFGEEENEELAQAGKKIEEMIKRVGPKTFYLTEDVWVDSEYKKGMDETEVKYLSDEYFELLTKYPEASKYFAIAEKVVVVIEGKAYRIIGE
jgi:hypothetical protein